MKFFLLTTLIAAALCTKMTVFLPESFSISKDYASKDYNDGLLATIAAYTTALPPYKGKAVETDRRYSGVFSKMAKSIVIAVEDSTEEEFPSLASRQTLSLHDTSDVDTIPTPKVRLSSFLRLSDDSELIESYDNISIEALKQQFNVDENGDVVFFDQKFNIHNKDDLQFLNELYYLYRLNEDKLHTYTAIVLKAAKNFSGEKRKAAMKQLDKAISECVRALRVASSAVCVLRVPTARTAAHTHTHTHTYGGFRREDTKADENDTSEKSEENGSKEESDAEGDEPSANYTGIAWITIFTVVSTVFAVLISTFMMVGVGDDCAKDTLLARSY